MIVILTQNVVNSVACVVTHLNDNMAVEKRCIVMISQLHVFCQSCTISSDRMLCTVADIQLGM